MARRSKNPLSAAASGARRLIGGKPKPEGDASPAKKASTKKASAKKAVAKKAPAKKAVAKKAPAKKAAAKKAVAKKAPAKKVSTSSTDVGAKKSPAKKAPAKKTAATKAAAKKAPAKKAPAKKVSTSSTDVGAKKAPAKKTAAKKAAAAKKPATSKQVVGTVEASVDDLVVKEGESSWTPAELAEVVAELNKDRAHAMEILQEQSDELDGLMRDAGDGAGHDQADLGTTSFERDHELSVVANERDKVAQIDRALARIENGSYGQCETCGNPIGKMRLMAFPRATLCMSCKQREERR